MVSECPVCRHRINCVRFMLSRKAFSCSHCRSLLSNDKNRRYFALVPLMVATVFGSLYLTRSGLAGDWVPIPLAMAVWFPLIIMLDRAIVLERCGFWCIKCGYDLRGQVNPQCPECGREFNSSETAQMELPDPTAVSQRQVRKRNYLRLILFIVLMAALIASLIISFRVYSKAKSLRTAPVPVQVSPAGS